ncbi:MAG: hypothetical protein IK055_01585 [Lachnospiraceae bacterium]|nr:hypothetical protein [Lachnospiraceae bacterium]
MEKSKKVKWIILSICAVALVVLGVLMVKKFGGEEKKPAKTNNNTSTPTAEVSPEAKDTVTVWCLTDVYGHDSDGEVRHTKTYEYDDQGRCISEINYLKWNEVTGEEYSSTSEYTTYTYDEQNHFTIQHNSVPEVSEYSYDVDGTLRSVVTYQPKQDGTLAKSWRVEYDKNSWIASEAYDLETGERVDADLISRDVNGNVISEKTYKAGESEWQVLSKSECDELGRVTTAYKVVNGQDQLYMENKYREDGSWTALSYDLEGDELQVDGSKEYDPSGRELEHLEIMPDGSVRMRDTTEYLDTSEGTVTKRVRTYYGELSRTLETRRNPEGKLTYVEAHEYGEDYESITLYEVFCDKEGRFERVVYKDAFELVYSYDEHGNCVRITGTGVDGEVWSTEYVYTPVEISPEQAEENKLFYDPVSLPDYGGDVMRTIRR